jgi:DNA-binding MarR family transcriptional regulator
MVLVSSVVAALVVPLAAPRRCVLWEGRNYNALRPGVKEKSKAAARRWNRASVLGESAGWFAPLGEATETRPLTPNFGGYFCAPHLKLIVVFRKKGSVRRATVDNHRPARSIAVRTMIDHLPLPTLLSQVLVAFTIEFDNEFEHQMPHRTTRQRSTANTPKGPWLVSMVMWSNCMQHVGNAGLTLRELEARAHTDTNLRGMVRWRYIEFGPDPADVRPVPPRSTWLIRPTRYGKLAQDIWQPLFGEIEKRWRLRFGKSEIEQLRKSLESINSRISADLPDCMPILGYGLQCRVRPPGGRTSSAAETKRRVHLSLAALLARVLLAFALEFEQESSLSLAICANILRVLDEIGILVREIPALSGVSKESISMALGFLQKKGIVVVEKDRATKGAKVARLTAKGLDAKAANRQLLDTLENRWHAQFGPDAIQALRESLERLVGESGADESLLSAGLEPYPDGWRASVRRPEMLPHFPMVLHRGGYPDGS